MRACLEGTSALRLVRVSQLGTLLALTLALSFGQNLFRAPAAWAGEPDGAQAKVCISQVLDGAPAGSSIAYRLVCQGGTSEEEGTRASVQEAAGDSAGVSADANGGGAGADANGGGAGAGGGTDADANGDAAASASASGGAGAPTSAQSGGESLDFSLADTTTGSLTLSFSHAGIWVYRLEPYSATCPQTGYTVFLDNAEYLLTVYVANTDAGTLSAWSTWSKSGQKAVEPELTHRFVEPSGESTGQKAETTGDCTKRIGDATAAALLASGFALALAAWRRRCERKRHG